MTDTIFIAPTSHTDWSMISQVPVECDCASKNRTVPLTDYHIKLLDIIQLYPGYVLRFGPDFLCLTDDRGSVHIFLDKTETELRELTDA